MTDALLATTFKTPQGFMAIAWKERSIVRTQLPEATMTKAKKRLCADLSRPTFVASHEAPTWIRNTAKLLTDVLLGAHRNLSDIPLAMEEMSPFCRRVYEFARSIPVGSTMTYGEVAAAIGSPGAARAVGRAMATNPFAPIVPCHRIVKSGGGLGGFSAAGGTKTKARMLRAESIEVARDRVVLHA